VCSPMMDNLHDALDRNKCSILWLLVRSAVSWKTPYTVLAN
jgi:hypothetical protein